jgi:Tetratricopeptide repeat
MVATPEQGMEPMFCTIIQPLALCWGVSTGVSTTCAWMTAFVSRTVAEQAMPPLFFNVNHDSGTLLPAWSCSHCATTSYWQGDVVLAPDGVMPAAQEMPGGLSAMWMFQVRPGSNGPMATSLVAVAQVRIAVAAHGSLPVFVVVKWNWRPPPGCAHVGNPSARNHRGHGGVAEVGERRDPGWSVAHVTDDAGRIGCAEAVMESGAGAGIAEGQVVAGSRTVADVAGLLRQLRRRQARHRGGGALTYRALAASTGWSLGVIADYFNGNALPPPDRFDVLVQMLGASPVEQGALATARDRAEEHRRASRTRVRERPVPRQLPPDVPGFVGRAEHLAELAVPAAVWVLSGTAGVGKTALAVHWAHRARAAYPDGQLYVDLRGYHPDEPVSGADALAGFLRALGVPDRDIPVDLDERAALYRSTLHGRHVLVVLDNAGTAEQVYPLLPGGPSGTALVTSRDSLAGLVARYGARRIPVDLLPRPPVPPVPGPVLAGTGPGRAWLDAERATLVDVAAYTVGHGWPGHAVRLSATICRYLETAGHYFDAVTVHSHARQAARLVEDRAGEAHALRNLGMVRAHQGDHARGASYLRQALVLSNDLGDRTSRASTLTDLGTVAYLRHRYPEALSYHRQALALFREIGEPSGEAEALNGLGEVLLATGAPGRARAFHTAALALARRTGDRHERARASQGLAAAGLAGRNVSAG